MRGARDSAQKTPDSVARCRARPLTRRALRAAASPRWGEATQTSTNSTNPLSGSRSVRSAFSGADVSSFCKLCQERVAVCPEHLFTSAPFEERWAEEEASTP